MSERAIYNGINALKIAENQLKMMVRVGRPRTSISGKNVEQVKSRGLRNSTFNK